MAWDATNPCCARPPLQPLTLHQCYFQPVFRSVSPSNVNTEKPPHTTCAETVRRWRGVLQHEQEGPPADRPQAALAPSGGGFGSPPQVALPQMTGGGCQRAPGDKVNTPVVKSLTTARSPRLNNRTHVPNVLALPSQRLHTYNLISARISFNMGSTSWASWMFSIRWAFLTSEVMPAYTRIPRFPKWP